MKDPRPRHRHPSHPVRCLHGLDVLRTITLFDMSSSIARTSRASCSRYVSTGPNQPAGKRQTLPTSHPRPALMRQAKYRRVIPHAPSSLPRRLHRIRLHLHASIKGTHPEHSRNLTERQAQRSQAPERGYRQGTLLGNTGAPAARRGRNTVQMRGGGAVPLRRDPRAILATPTPPTPFQAARWRGDEGGRRKGKGKGNTNRE